MTEMTTHNRVKGLLEQGFEATDRGNKMLSIIKATEKENPSVRAKFLPLGAQVVETYTDVIMGTASLIAAYKMWIDDDDEVVEDFVNTAADQFQVGLLALNTALDSIDAALDEVTK